MEAVLRGGLHSLPEIPMTASGQLQFDLADTVTVFVVASDGVVIDVIENVDLGDPIAASRNGRTPLKEAALWAALAWDRYTRSRASDASTSANRAAAGGSNGAPNS